MFQEGEDRVGVDGLGQFLPKSMCEVLNGTVRGSSLSELGADLDETPLMGVIVYPDIIFSDSSRLGFLHVRLQNNKVPR